MSTSSTEPTTVVLGPEHLENMRREMLKTAAQGLKTASEYVGALAEVEWAPDIRSSDLVSDAIGTVRCARVDLECVEALGWPDLEPDRGA